MDEPSMGLAPILVERSFEIKQVNDDGVAILVVEQNANVSLSIADRGYVLSTGRVVLEGKADELIENDDLRKPTWDDEGTAVGLTESSMNSVADCRSRFPIFERLVYVNSCSQGALSDSVRAAYEDYLTDWDEKGAPWAYWVERADAARAAFAGLVGAAGAEVAVTTSLSAGVSALASALDYGERPRVVVSDFEFPTVGQIWHAQEPRGAEVVHVPQSDGEIPVEHFDELIDERTKLVAVTAVCYRNGARLPIEEIVEIAHARGALVLLDAYQAIGSYPIDVRELGVDFVGAGALKYLLASAGLGFLWCREALVESLLPTQTGWFANEDIFEMDIEYYSAAPDARRFDAGTPPVPNIYAGVAGSS
jgi:selenocysteine lyase/cysteine desulfurase